MSSPLMIFGWQPSQNDTQVDIPHGEPLTTSSLLQMPQLDSLSLHTSYTQSPNFTLQASSPTSSTSSLFPEPDIPPDPKRDPAWVARPRNPFIIFRCEYSKANAKDAKDSRRVRRLPGSHPQKTLSCRAAEAWHELPLEEKDRFKALAEQERDEHARKHPHYRFRPMKRLAGQKRNPKPPKVRQPSNLDDERPLPRQPPPTPEPQESTIGSKGNRPRAYSVPTPMGQQPFLQARPAVAPKPEFKRSRSIGGCMEKLQDEAPSWPGPEGAAYDPRILQRTAHTDSGAYIPEEPAPVSDSPLQHDFSTIYHPTPTSHISPLEAVASSLACWNDVAPAGPWGFASPPLQHSWGPSQMGGAVQPVANFTSPENGIMLGHPPYPADSWDPAALPFDILSSPLESDLIFTPSSNGSSYTMFYDDLERANQLQEFSIGLNECAPITTDATNQDTISAFEMDGYFPLS